MITFRPVKAGTTDVSVIVRVIDSTDGTPETGVAYNTAGIDLEYRRDGAASVDITEATLAGADAAHADGGFVHIGNGLCRVDLPDAACASGAAGVLVHGTITGMIVIPCYVPLVAFDPYDAVRLGLTALPNVASGAAGALLTAGTGTAQLNVTAGVGDADVREWLGTGVATPTVAGVPEVDVTYVGGSAITSEQGTAQAVAAGTITLESGASAEDGAYEGWQVTIVSATTGAKQNRQIESYVGATKVATLTENWDITPTGTVVYDLAPDVIQSVSVVGTVDANVVSMAAGTITAAAIATGAIDADALASDTITAAKIAADAIGASELATDAVAEIATAVLTTAMTESYSTDGGTLTLAQALYELVQHNQEHAISGTTWTVKKRDGSTTALTLTLNDATTPTAATRAS